MSTPLQDEPETPLATLRNGLIEVGFARPDFESAVRGLLAQPLLEHGLTPDQVEDIVAAVIQRERAASTRAGAIALPHARVAGIPRIVAGLGINPNGVYPDSGVCVMVAFVSPLDAAGQHLRFLSCLAKTFRDATFLHRIEGARTAGEAQALLTSAGSPSQ
jgi:mannitol/fructose-specific phosphotransferase system IIA component (Ntr-type)